MVIQEPLDFSRYKGLDKDHTFFVRSPVVMCNLMLLSGQEYVDLYAADVKRSLPRKVLTARFPRMGRGAPVGVRPLRFRFRPHLRRR